MLHAACGASAQHFDGQCGFQDSAVRRHCGCVRGCAALVHAQTSTSGTSGRRASAARGARAAVASELCGSTPGLRFRLCGHGALMALAHVHAADTYPAVNAAGPRGHVPVAFCRPARRDRPRSVGHSRGMASRPYKQRFVLRACRLWPLCRGPWPRVAARDSMVHPRMISSSCRCARRTARQLPLPPQCGRDVQ